mgnify:CR=1 FL=1
MASAITLGDAYREKGEGSFSENISFKYIYIRITLYSKEGSRYAHWQELFQYIHKEIHSIDIYNSAINKLKDMLAINKVADMSAINKVAYMSAIKHSQPSELC